MTRESAVSATNLWEEDIAGGSEISGFPLKLEALLKSSVDTSILSPNVNPFGYYGNNETI